MSFLKKLFGPTPPSCAICLESESAELPLLSAATSQSDTDRCNTKLCAECLKQHLHRELVSNAKRASPILLGCPNRACKATFGVDFIRAHADAETLAVVDEVLARVPRSNPSKLQDFGYSFTADRGRLEPRFHFVTQTHYDCFGDLVAPYVQQLMRDKFGMVEVNLPRGDEHGALVNNVFLSPDALTADRLMLLIQGSGAVRAGQWARAVCLNDCLELGSILPYLARAKKNGMGVIVFNPNLNVVDVPARVFTHADFFDPKTVLRPPGIKRVPIPGSETAPTHTVTVFDEFVPRAAAKDIVIVAHSAGGHCTMQLLRDREDELMPRLRAIAFTDSVHSVSLRESRRVVDFFTQGHAQDWVQSDKPLDTPIREEAFQGSAGCPCVSAGHTKHEYTSPAAIESVFAFLCKKLGSKYDDDVEPIDYSLVAAKTGRNDNNDDNNDDNGDDE